jgi:hypothetical protein
VPPVAVACPPDALVPPVVAVAVPPPAVAVPVDAAQVNESPSVPPVAVPCRPWR